MDRRSFCKTAGALGVVAGTAGCLGVLGDPGAEGAILGPQIKISARHRSRATATRCPSSPSPIRSATRRSRQHSSRASARCCGPLYTNCPDGVCPALILRLRRGQEAAAEAGYGDQVAFLPTTFDPERDTAETLREYAGQQGVDLDAGNWHFLRPETYERAQEIHDEHFGLKIEKTPADDIENLEYRFPHYGLIILANKRGIIERAYPRGPKTDIERLVDDLKRVATA